MYLTLGTLLREEEQVEPKKAGLFNEIEYAIKSSSLPTRLKELLHDVRELGNFAAHPEKSTQTGAIIEVDADEATFCLNVVYALFDHYFVQASFVNRIRSSVDSKKAEKPKR